MATFSERLRSLRLKRNITQAQLGTAFDVAQQTIGKWEKGLGASPDPETIVRLADYFSVSTDYLLGRTEYAEVSNTPVKPKTVAAHTDEPMTPEMEARIQELIQEAFDKYGKK
jgi:transcriptional regulator with XRE-family HTH domain